MDQILELKVKENFPSLTNQMTRHSLVVEMRGIQVPQTGRPHKWMLHGFHSRHPTESRNKYLKQLSGSSEKLVIKLYTYRSDQILQIAKFGYQNMIFCSDQILQIKIKHQNIILIVVIE